jgi:hypothetical protein
MAFGPQNLSQVQQKSNLGCKEKFKVRASRKKQSYHAENTRI